jgi:signal transduction histidine kinase
MLEDQVPRGPGRSGITPDSGQRLTIGVRRRAGTGRTPGSALIAVAAWLLALTGGGALFVSFTAQYAYIRAVRRQDAASVIEALLLDLLMIVFTLLALGLSRAGQSARAERALILLCAAASAYMNVSAADVASPRSVAAYAVAPLALAVAVDRVVAVIRRHVLADAEPSAWTTVGRAAAATVRTAGLVLLYCLRFALAAPQTARGLRRMVLDTAPLPPLPQTPRPEALQPPRTKKAVLVALYRAHPHYGDRSQTSRVAAELAPQAGLQAGTARTYLYAELDGRTP